MKIPVNYWLRKDRFGEEAVTEVKESGALAYEVEFWNRRGKLSKGFIKHRTYLFLKLAIVLHSRELREK